MRVLVISNSGFGLYRFRKELMEKVAQNNELFFCVPDDEFVKSIEDMGCIFIDNPFLERHGTNILDELKLLRFYKKIIREIKPGIVFTYTIKPNVYGGMACSTLGIPYVANVTGLGTSIENGGLLQTICLILYKKGLKKAEMVFFQNEENKRFMVDRGIVKGVYDMLPGSGVNLDQYQVYPYPKGPTVDFVFIARIMKEKGIDQYLDAARAIRAKHPETRFHVCGFCEQDYSNTLSELNNAGTIIYHGLVSNMTDIYRLISCTVHPTYYPEGISNVLLESAASGRPIITTDRSGCREVVEDGVNGFVVKQQDSHDLIDKIEKFLELSIEERAKMGLAGRAKVESEFDRNIVIHKYFDLIKMVNERNA